MKRLRFLVSLLCIALFSLGTQAQSEAAFSDETIAEFQGLLDAQSESIGVVLRIDSPIGIFSGATGYANLEDEIAMQPDDSFRIGSISKMYTAAVAIRLMEEDVLSLDDKLADWLPEIAAELPNGDDITLRHLLSHTSGLFEPFENFVFAISILEGRIEKQWTAEEYAAEILPIMGGAYFEPSEDWHYSNANYHFMGMVLERATGSTIAELYHEYLYEPLGLEVTYLANMEDAVGNLVDGYTSMANPENLSNWNASVAWAAGGIVSTTEEVAIFTRALFKGELFEEEDSLGQMLETVPIDEGYSYGLGVIVTDEFIGHAGGTPGFSALAYYNPEFDTVIIIGQNTEDADFTPLLESLYPSLEALGLK